MVFILFTGKSHRAGFSILRPVPNRFAIAVAGSRKICHILRICVGLAVKFNGCCISGYTCFRAGGWLLYC